jgi:hypothetical protein
MHVLADGTTNYSPPPAARPHIRTPSIEHPIFSCENALAWLQECIFELARIPNDSKVKWTNAHIKGKEKTWLNSSNI